MKSIKKNAAELAVYISPLDFPCEKLKNKDKVRYQYACEKYTFLKSIGLMLSKNDLLECQDQHFIWSAIGPHTSIEELLNYLYNETLIALELFRDITNSSNIDIPEHVFKKFERVAYNYL